MPLNLPRLSRLYPVLFCAVFIASNLHAAAQNEACAAWIESLAGEVKNASVEESKWVKKVFGSNVCSGSVTAKHLEDIQSTVELLKTQRITASKGLLDYLHAADSIVHMDTTRWDDWHLVIQSMASDKKLRKRLQPFLANSKDLMLHDILGRGPRHTWQLNGKPWYFETMDSRNLVRFDSCNLVLGFKGTPCALKALRVNGIYLTQKEKFRLLAFHGSVRFTTRSQRSRRCLLQPWIFQRMTSGWTVFYFIPLFPNSRFWAN